VVNSLAPTSAIAGSPSLTLTVGGANFVAGSVVLWNGADRATTFVSATQLTAVIPAADIAAASTAQVAVRNPAPGGSSAAVAFTVASPPPTLGLIEPDAVAAGSPQLALTLRGANFVTGSVARWNGESLATTFRTETEMVAEVPVTLLQTLGDVAVSIANPPPDGGESASLPLRVGGVLRLSVTQDGTDVDGGSDISAVSADGRYVAFASKASNLVPGDTNDAFDVFVRDTCLNAPSGCTPGTQRVSVSGNGAEGNGNSGWTPEAPELSVAISGTGRYIAFVSAATNLVTGDTNNWNDVFLRDTCRGVATGCVPQTILVSAGIGGTPSNSHSTHVAISRSGLRVAFISPASNLVANDTNDAIDVFVRETCGGTPGNCLPETTRVSVSDSGIQSNRDSIHPSFSGDGRFIVFASSGTNLVADDTNDAFDVFRRDTCFGSVSGCVPSTVRVSLASTGQQSTGGQTFFPKVSSDGRYVSFVSGASDLVPGDSNRVNDLFLRDTCLGAASGCVPSTTALSLSSVGELVGGAWLPALSDSARYAVFTSSEWRLVAGDSNNTFDIFVRDTCIDAPSGCVPETRRLSVAFDGSEGNGASTSPAISADGRFVCFSSGASNLVPGGVTPTYFLNAYLVETRP
jgi:Tol biopolymer transport system component